MFRRDAEVVALHIKSAIVLIRQNSVRSEVHLAAIVSRRKRQWLRIFRCLFRLRPSRLYRHKERFDFPDRSRVAVEFLTICDSPANDLRVVFEELGHVDLVNAIEAACPEGGLPVL